MASDLLKKISKYCASAERSTHDVISKLEAWNAAPEERESIIKILRDGGFLNDERYAKAFVSEKWNTSRWGRLKIENALIRKHIDEKLIRNSLAIIDPGEYMEVLEDLLRIKYKSFNSGRKEEDARRVMMFALSRGFEEEIVREWIEKEILEDEKNADH